jgi:aspartate aminotransferase
MDQLQISKRAQEVIASPIRKFFPLIQEAESRGIKVCKLNVGDPDLPVPPIFFQTLRKYHKKTLGYAPSPGLKEHTAAWQKYYKGFGVNLSAANIIPTVGGAEAILLALEAVADFGDEVLVFEPLYTSYKAFAKITGIKLIPITLSIENDFALPPISEIEKKISPKTRAVVIINPDNPTGKLWSDKELDAVIKVAKAHGLFIISDETYREIRFDGKKPGCLLAKNQARQNVILCDSVSKRFSMPGARIGCVASFNNSVMAGILKFAQARLSAGTLEQLATIPLLTNSRPYTGKIQKEYLRRRNVVAEGLRQIPGIKFKPAQGAFYQAVKLPVKSAEDFVKFMISDFSYKGRTVMVTPMRDFYLTLGLGQNEIRIAYVLNMADLKRALEVLKKGLETYCSK